MGLVVAWREGFLVDGRVRVVNDDGRTLLCPVGDPSLARLAVQCGHRHLWYLWLVRTVKTHRPDRDVLMRESVRPSDWDDLRGDLRKVWDPRPDKATPRNRSLRGPLPPDAALNMRLNAVVGVLHSSPVLALDFQKPGSISAVASNSGTDPPEISSRKAANCLSIGGGPTRTNLRGAFSARRARTSASAALSFLSFRALTGFSTEPSVFGGRLPKTRSSPGVAVFIGLVP